MVLHLYHSRVPLQRIWIHLVKISPYNSRLMHGQAKTLWHKGILMKTCNNKHLKWVAMAPSSFGQPNHHLPLIGYSLFLMAHGIEVVLMLDIAEATYLLPSNAPHQPRTSLHNCAQQLQKHLEDLLEMSVRVLKARKQSTAEFFKCFFLYHPGLWLPSGLPSPCLQLLYGKRT